MLAALVTTGSPVGTPLFYVGRMVELFAALRNHHLYITMQESTANDFYERIVEGTDYTKKITLEHGSGAALEDVEMHPVDKKTLASVIQSLPEDMFGAVEEADNPDEAEEMLEEQGMSMSSLGPDTIDAFEKLVSKSLEHPDMTNTQMNQIVEALDFEMLFEIGGEVIDMSFSDGDAIKDFRAQE